MTGLMLLTCADCVYYRISPRCLCLYRGLSRLRSEVICSYLRLCCAVGPESAQCLIWIWNWLDARCWFRCLTSCLARCDLCWLDMAAVRFWQKQTRAEFCFWDAARENVKPYLELRRSATVSRSRWNLRKRPNNLSFSRIAYCLFLSLLLALTAATLF